MRCVLPPLRHLVLALSLPLVLTVLGVSGCGSEDPGATAAGEGVVLEVMIEDGRARHAAERVEVATGEEVELVVMADSAGAIHVESHPGKEIEYQPGTTTFSLQVDQPGLVDVELHDPDQLLVQLEVR